MTEADAKAWMEERFPERMDILSRFADLVRNEATRQNLISASTVDHIWSRHIVDSAQLLRHAPGKTQRWIDIGSGAGFPGIVIALLSEAEVVLVEPRRLRVEFLNACISSMGVTSVSTVLGKAQHVPSGSWDVISARAVMSLSALFQATHHLSWASTRYILPKGASCSEDLDAARKSWNGTFHVEHSVLGREMGIVIAERVRRR